MKIDPNAPAYPQRTSSRMEKDREGTTTLVESFEPGMSIRAAIAKDIMAAIFAGTTDRCCDGTPDVALEPAAETAVIAADMLIKALNEIKATK